MFDKDENKIVVQYDRQLMEEYQNELINSRKLVNRIYRFVENISKSKDNNFNSIISNIRKQVGLKKISKYNSPTVTSSTQISDDILSKERIAVYTVVFGGYDNIFQPRILPDNCDFYIITDNDGDFGAFTKKDYDMKLVDGYSPTKKNRFFKMHPEVVFPDYRFSIYIDGNVEIMSDLTALVNRLSDNGVGFYAHGARNCIYNEVKACKILKKGNAKLLERQCVEYAKDGFPEQFGMVEATVIAREHNNEQCVKLMENWWGEFCKWESRDQISFPYVLWKKKLKILDVAVLGGNIHNELRFKIHEHKTK